MRLKEAIPRHYFTSDFCFPKTILVGTVFQDTNAVENMLQEEGRVLGVPLNRMVNDRDFYPSASNWTSVRYRCKVCRISLRFSKRDGVLVANTINNEHKHSRLKGQKERSDAKTEDPTETHIAQEEVKPRTRSSARNKSTAVEQKTIKAQQQTIAVVEDKSEPSPIKIEKGIEPDVFLPEENTFSSLLKWVGKHEYQGRGDVGKGTNTILLVSPLMLNSCIKFGDLVDFRVISDATLKTEVEGDEYKVGVFSVFDTNERPLLAGFALLREESSRAVCQIVRSFVSIHHRGAFTFITGDEPYILEAVEHLIEKQYLAGMHRVNSECALASISRKLEGTLTEVSCIIAKLQQAMFCRSEDNYMSIRANLDQNNLYKTVEEEIVRKCGFYLDNRNIPAFYGLGTANPLKLIGTIRDLLNSRLTIIDFVSAVDEIDSKLKSKSLRKFERYEEDVGKMFSNSRLTQLRDSFEKKIVERFMENYAWAMRECVIIGKPRNIEESCVVVKHSMGGQYSYNVQKWRCECKELERTGIACPHLILVATLEESKSYIGLVNPRWRQKLCDNS